MRIKTNEIKSETVKEAINEIEKKYGIIGDKAEAIASHIVYTDEDWTDEEEEITDITDSDGNKVVKIEYDPAGNMGWVHFQNGEIIRYDIANLKGTKEAIISLIEKGNDLEWLEKYHPLWRIVIRTGNWRYPQEGNT